VRVFSLAQNKKRLLTAPQLRREGEVRQNPSRGERNQGKNVSVDRNRPLTRPARLGNAPSRAPISPGRGLFDRGFVLREQAKIAQARSQPCSRLSDVVAWPLFSSTFPVRSCNLGPAKTHRRVAQTLSLMPAPPALGGRTSAADRVYDKLKSPTIRVRK
jgi:hypothetical protein